MEIFTGLKEGNLESSKVGGEMRPSNGSSNTVLESRPFQYAPPSACFQEYIQDDPIMQISGADNGHTSPDTPIFPLITPPQSTEDTSLPFESSEGTCLIRRRP